jgi:hypothetical protein
MPPPPQRPNTGKLGPLDAFHRSYEGDSFLFRFRRRCSTAWLFLFCFSCEGSRYTIVCDCGHLRFEALPKLCGDTRTRLWLQQSESNDFVACQQWPEPPTFVCKAYAASLVLLQPTRRGYGRCSNLCLFGQMISS